MSAAALSILITTFTDDQERNRALGAWGAIAARPRSSGCCSGILTGGLCWECDRPALRNR
ncbi:MAG: hypothetical protein ACR2LV_03645 [Solirubrobacteraceae bacterium]